MGISVDPKEFLEVTLPALRSGDAAALAQAVRVRWKARELCPLLRNADADVRRVAAVTMGLVGDMRAVSCLTGALHDPDPQVNQMAEHGLWSIWFRSGDVKAHQPFREGVAMLAAESYQAAVQCFEKATRIDPMFAEAFNQRAIAHFFLTEWELAVNCCRSTITLVPVHFGAIAGMGHCYTQLGELRRALACYQRALEINPRMSAIAQMIQRLQGHAKSDNDSSGMFSVDHFATR